MHRTSLRKGRDLLPRAGTRVESLVSVLSQTSVLDSTDARLNPVHSQLLSVSGDVRMGVSDASSVVSLVYSLDPVGRHLRTRFSDHVLSVRRIIQTRLRLGIHGRVRRTLRPLTGAQGVLRVRGSRLGTLMRDHEISLTSLRGRVVYLGTDLGARVDSVRGGLTRLPTTTLSITETLAAQVIARMCKSISRVRLVPTRTSP